VELTVSSTKDAVQVRLSEKAGEGAAVEIPVIRHGIGESTEALVDEESRTTVRKEDGTVNRREDKGNDFVRELVEERCHYKARERSVGSVRIEEEEGDVRLSSFFPPSTFLSSWATTFEA